MVQLSTSVLLAVSAVAVHGLPFTKRIAQTISDSTTKWVAACQAAGGGEDCSTVSVNAFETLLIGAGVCDQQNAADSMIDLAKQLNNNADMIQLAQIFAQQPRNTPNSLAVPYCQQAPNNTELNGLYQCQFEGANQNLFVGNLAVGQPGTIPFGLTAALSPLGSCPANPSGPITDGAQLVDITTNPGVGSSGSSSGSGSGSATAAATTESATATAADNAASATATATDSDGDDGDDGGDCVMETETESATATAAASATAAATTASSAAASTSTSSFLLSNGQEAQKQNAEFSSLTNGSSCTSGTDACVGGDFAQCVDGSYVTQSCGSGLSCFALPLVNKAGTSITCTTESDAASRIAATGATGGVTGSGSDSSSSASASTAAAATGSAADEAAAVGSSSTASATSSSSSSSSSFLLSNGQDAQKQNAQFASLTANSSCTEGEDACVGGEFAQCVDGAYVTQSCGSNLSCFALPLVNKAGTSITCTTESDAASRIAATGATGGVTGGN